MHQVTWRFCLKHMFQSIIWAWEFSFLTSSLVPQPLRVWSPFYSKFSIWIERTWIMSSDLPKTWETRLLGDFFLLKLLTHSSHTLFSFRLQMVNISRYKDFPSCIHPHISCFNSHPHFEWAMCLMLHNSNLLLTKICNSNLQALVKVVMLSS